ncbi:MAG: histidine phosphatase family protein [Planctomycetota bacterium]|nr:histidine phosphatase family protein [Planctomycetota bacterium]
MKELLILRHAKSSWEEDGLPDHERPLNKRGRKASKRMGRLLAEEGLVPDHILSSTAVRARRTAERAAEAAGYEGTIELREALYHASPSTIMEVVGTVDSHVDRLLLVGHNPGLEVLTGVLTSVYHRFPTAALMHVRFDGITDWAEAHGRPAELLDVWLPRLLME